jgi:hypothetical protein
MRLEHNIITTIEGLLEKGHTVDLRILKGEHGERVTVEKRPDSEDEIRIHPTLADQAAPVTLSIGLSKRGPDPVIIAIVKVPAGFVISGIKGHQGISQEIPAKERTS